jgi:hypothetical protein
MPDENRGQHVGRLYRLCDNRWIVLVLILFISTLTIILPHMWTGLHASGDLGIYLSFARELRSAIGAGDLLPGWADINEGYGSVGLRFYPPLSFYLSAMIAGLIDDWYYTLWIYFYVCSIVGCWGIYLFARDWGTPAAGLLSASLYAIAPFHLAEIYRFSLYAEFAAGSILPFCFLFATRVCRKRGWRDSILLAVAYGLLVITHLPLTILGTTSLLIYVGFLIDRRVLKQTIIRLGTSFALAMLASAFYWVRILTELEWVGHYQDKYASGTADYSKWLFPMSMMGGQGGIYSSLFRNLDAMIVLTGLLLIPFLMLLAMSKGEPRESDRRVLFSITATAAFCFFMVTAASSFLWYSFDLLRRVQYPWRWLSVFSALAVVSFSLSISQIWLMRPNLRRIIATCVLCMIALLAVYNVRQNFGRPNIISPIEFDAILNERYSPAGTNYEAWWPVWASANALLIKDRVMAGERDTEIQSWKRERRSFRIGKGTTRTARIATFYYPHWTATVNGVPVAIGYDEHGAIQIPLQENVSDVVLYFKEPELNKLANWVSLVTWLVLLLLIAHHTFAANDKGPRIRS